MTAQCAGKSFACLRVSVACLPLYDCTGTAAAPAGVRDGAAAVPVTSLGERAGGQRVEAGRLDGGAADGGGDAVDGRHALVLEGTDDRVLDEVRTTLADRVH